jgi:hypothetical protein
VALTLALLAGFTVLKSSPADCQSTVPIFVSGKDRPYVPLSTKKTELITVKGPGELRIVTRLRFRPKTTDKQRYTMFIRVDGGAEKEVAFKDVERSRTAMFRDGTLGVPGRLMDHDLRLGRGYHNIEIRAGQNPSQIFYRHVYTPKKARRRSWVPLTPLEAPEMVELIARETIVPYFRNPAGAPFLIEVIGPTELRIFTRIENTHEMRGRIHYRLQVRDGGQVINTFQLSSRRSDIASYRKNDVLVPGRAAEVVIPITEGRHRLEIQPLDHNKATILARFMLPRDDLSLTAD